MTNVLFLRVSIHAAAVGGLCVGSAAASPPACGDTPFLFPWNSTSVRKVVSVDMDGTGQQTLLAFTGSEIRRVNGLTSHGSLDLDFALLGTLPFAPAHISQGDFDGDGDIDFVISSSSSTAQSYAYLRNDGGSFSSPAQYTVGTNSKSTSVGDINNDGMDDFVAGSVSPFAVYIFRGSGSVPLQPIVLSAPNQVLATAVLDFDMDGDLDLVAATTTASGSPAQLVPYRNNGNYSFSQLAPRSLTFLPGPIETADLNLDGRLDLVISSSSSSPTAGYATLLTTTTTIGAVAAYNLQSSGSAIVAKDLNDDGLPDLCVAFNGSGFAGIEIRFNLGNGNFGEPVVRATAFFMTNLSVLDVDGDGACEAVSIANTGHFVLRGRPNGGLAGAAILPLAGEVSATALGDINGDGRDDLVARRASGSGIDVYRLSEQGNLSPAQEVAGDSTGASQILRLADLDDDGDVDLSMVNGPSGSIALSLNVDGVLGALSSTTLQIQSSASQLRLGNIAGSPALEAVFARAASPQVGWLRHEGGAWQTSWTPVPQVTSQPSWLDVGDLDADGFDDLIVLVDTSTISWLRNDGQGSFSSPQFIASGGLPALADLDGDGDLDVACRVFNSGGENLTRLAVYANDGSGNFALATLAPFSANSGEFTARDVDRDGIVDLVLRDPSVGRLWFNRGLGGGHFEPDRRFADRTGSGSTAMGDLDGDGLLDLVDCVSTAKAIVALSPLCASEGTLAGDLNSDGVVGGADLGLLLHAWGPVPAGHPADISPNGIVDGADLGMLLQSWSH